jgi:hypothetical protein
LCLTCRLRRTPRLGYAAFGSRKNTRCVPPAPLYSLAQHSRRLDGRGDWPLRQGVPITSSRLSLLRPPHALSPVTPGWPQRKAGYWRPPGRPIRKGATPRRASSAMQRWGPWRGDEVLVDGESVVLRVMPCCAKPRCCERRPPMSRPLTAAEHSALTGRRGCGTATASRSPPLRATPAGSRARCSRPTAAAS